MIRLVITCDYEIFGNGTGQVSTCMLSPAEKMMELCELYGARMTFFVEVLELWTFQQTLGFERQGHAIEQQIKNMFERGHDVQLHLHPQWLGANYENKQWQLNYDSWRISSLSEQPEKLVELFQSGKDYLEQLASAVGKTDYSCTAFRAGAWSIQPEEKVLDAMQQVGFSVDTTLAPGRQYDDGVTYYNFKPQDPFRVSYPIKSSIQAECTDGALYEMPIFTCRTNLLRNFYHLLLALLYRLPKRPTNCTGNTVIPQASTQSSGKWSGLWELLSKRHLMLDLSGRVPAEQVIYCLKKALKTIPRPSPVAIYPLIAICHTKNFGNPKEWERIFNWVDATREIMLDPLDQVPVFSVPEQAYIAKV